MLFLNFTSNYQLLVHTCLEHIVRETQNHFTKCYEYLSITYDRTYQKYGNDNIWNQTCDKLRNGSTLITDNLLRATCLWLKRILHHLLNNQ